MSNEFAPYVIAAGGGGGGAGATMTPLSAMGTLGTTDDTSVFQAACDAGGAYWVPKGTYRIAGTSTITLSGDVDFYFENGVTFMVTVGAAASSTIHLWTIDGGASKAANWNFYGQIQVDMSDRPAADKRKFMFMRNADNFHIDSITMVHGASSASISAAQAGAVIIGFAESLGIDSITNGSIDFLQSLNAPYGYGPIQLSGGVGWVHFGTIWTDAGACARFETDGGVSSAGGTAQSQSVHDITIDMAVTWADVPGTGYGNSVLLIANHGANINNCTINRIVAKNCRWGVAVSDNTNLPNASFGGGFIRNMTVESGYFFNCGDGIRRTSTNTNWATQNIRFNNLIADTCKIQTYNIDGGLTANGAGRGFDVINGMIFDNCDAKNCDSYGFQDTAQAGVIFTDVSRVISSRVYNCQGTAGGPATYWNNLVRVEIEGLECVDDRGTPKMTYAIAGNGVPQPTAIYVSNLTTRGLTGNSSLSGGATITYTDGSTSAVVIKRQYASGHWADGVGCFPTTAAGGTALTLNKLYAVPFDVEVAQTFQDLGIEILTSAGASGVIRLGLYSDSNGFPQTLKAGSDQGTISSVVSSGTALQTSTLGSWSYALTVGRWHLAMVAQVSACSVRCRQSVGAPYASAGTAFPASSVAIGLGVAESGTATNGALPGTFPVNLFSGIAPRLLMQAA